MKYSSKDELLADARSEFSTLQALIESVPAERFEEPGVWGDGWTVLDLVAHLAEWQDMFLGWHDQGLSGMSPEMPAPGYRWNETPALNRVIQQKHRGRSRTSVLDAFLAGHARIMDLLEQLPEAEILEPGHFEWTGRNALVTYAAANTASHYRFARKVLRRWMRGR